MHLNVYSTTEFAWVAKPLQSRAKPPGSELARVRNPTGIELVGEETTGNLQLQPDYTSIDYPIAHVFNKILSYNL